MRIYSHFLLKAKCERRSKTTGNPCPAACIMKVFITASYGNKKEIDRICSIVKNAGFDDYCFARDEGFFDDQQLMMEKAREKIEECDALLFDASEESTGRAIEVGIAYANKKKIIVTLEEGVVIKDTLRGVADKVITYKNIEEIEEMLNKLCLKWTKK